VVTFAAAAVRLTGRPCGPMSGRRGASSASGLSGRRVCPTVTTVTVATAAPTAVRKPRRLSPSASSRGRRRAAAITGALTATCRAIEPTATQAT
jgi:hypothetical protein